MKDFMLAKPIVLRESLKDMNQDEYKKALRMLEGSLIIHENHLRIPDGSEEEAICGSEAVAIYRRFLGLRDVSIHSIPILSIYSAIEDMTILLDINDHLDKVINRSNRLETLIQIDAPLILYINEYKMLQESVESLFESDWALGERMSDKARTFSLKDLGFTIGYCIQQR